MKSLHIKSNNEQLYTVIHHPSENNKNNRKHAVVICSPITHEHDASYWAIRQLAIRLSKLGFDVARFDYFASGNSAGLSQQASLQTCVQNITDIGQFLARNSNSEKVTYIGLRLGAVLASMSAINSSPDQLILWDPIISGKSFLSQLDMMHEKYLQKMNRTGSHQHNLGQEYLGYPYSDSIVAELNQAQLDNIEFPVDTTLSILTSPGNTEQNQLIEKVRGSRLQLQHEIATKGAINWHDISIIESSFLPRESINQICNFLKDS
ncbi:MAG: hypothetical protein QNL62_19905 [Gammaproteobacteria bacterium]|nr:hypothetical protein [Gammaproteobacteria bacterium]